jgi:hypothetical protein
MKSLFLIITIISLCSCRTKNVPRFTERDVVNSPKSVIFVRKFTPPPRPNPEVIVKGEVTDIHQHMAQHESAFSSTTYVFKILEGYIPNLENAKKFEFITYELKQAFYPGEKLLFSFYPSGELWGIEGYNPTRELSLRVPTPVY